ncbi:GT4 family glycosyltransferase PelF [Paracraurococcus lichenis]|uniref:GT4 family glycosyltransferase PelF n=1 Tax=Paracraurococcus lichenis TaxID=3064888 RepID=A0ABT9E6E5_9PROT|nr:GT4 family glycosyltransferase PelF [Paracraurococcus sp. LOR1-02]MDO9711752.1 GT4 family glycosyltransferase PelF [Paracraurococcus sp. LOR1-02]
MIWMSRKPLPEADICLVLEGAYPFIAGGVSSWTHDLIRAHPDLTFHLATLAADEAPKPLRFDLPANVIQMTTIPLQQSEARLTSGRGIERMIGALQRPLAGLFARGGLAEFRALLQVLRQHPRTATRAALMNSEAAFRMVEAMYEAAVPGSSFLNYFWTWRSLAGGLFSVLLAPLPRARVYHAVSTGYAGLLVARAVLETGRPGLLTEHGIYTNERRVEIAMAEWLADRIPGSLGIEARRRDLRDVWIEAFTGYSRVCYEACDRITTLYAGNQLLQIRDGAPPDRLTIIPNGVDYDGFSAVPRDPAPRPPTVALIGRAVPIKDVKTYIRAAAILRQMVPEVRVLLLGPTDEDPAYFQECTDMVAHLGLQETFTFTGRVRLQDYLGKVDVVALTSISEAQPLVLLEAGAAGVPSVATDVGSCRDMIEGRADEDPPLGPGGFVTPLADPAATARGLAALLLDPALRARCGEAIRRRTERYYNKRVVDRLYRELYEAHLALPDDAAEAAAA